MTVEKILFPTEFKDLSFRNLEAIFELKKAGLKEIVLFHVIPRDTVGFVPFGGYMKDEETKLKEETRIRFRDWQESISERGLSSRIEIVIGDPVPAILHAAEDEKADMIVCGQREKARIEDLIPGTITNQLATRSKVPILIFKAAHPEVTAETADGIFKTPLIALDWTEVSERAVKMAISLKEVLTKVILFHNIKVKEKEDVAPDEKECHRRLDEYRGRLEAEGIEAETHTGAGDKVEEEIFRTANEREASMIIMGTRGTGRWKELFMGSVSHHVAKESDLPTLLVP